LLAHRIVSRSGRISVIPMTPPNALVELLLQSYGDTRTVHAAATALETADLVPLPVP